MNKSLMFLFFIMSFHLKALSFESPVPIDNTSDFEGQIKKALEVTKKNYIFFLSKKLFEDLKFIKKEEAPDGWTRYQVKIPQTIRYTTFLVKSIDSNFQLKFSKKPLRKFLPFLKSHQPETSSSKASSKVTSTLEKKSVESSDTEEEEAGLEVVEEEEQEPEVVEEEEQEPEVVEEEEQEPEVVEEEEQEPEVVVRTYLAPEVAPKLVLNGSPSLLQKPTSPSLRTYIYMINEKVLEQKEIPPGLVFLAPEMNCLIGDEKCSILSVDGTNNDIHLIQDKKDKIIYKLVNRRCIHIQYDDKEGEFLLLIEKNTHKKKIIHSKSGSYLKERKKSYQLIAVSLNNLEVKATHVLSFHPIKIMRSQGHCYWILGGPLNEEVDDELEPEVDRDVLNGSPSLLQKRSSISLGTEYIYMISEKVLEQKEIPPGLVFLAPEMNCLIGDGEGSILSVDRTNNDIHLIQDKEDKIIYKGNRRCIHIQYDDKEGEFLLLLEKNTNKKKIIHSKSGSHLKECKNSYQLIAVSLDNLEEKATHVLSFHPIKIMRSQGHCYWILGGPLNEDEI